MQCALERVSSYVRLACSRDSISHYLYSKVIAERRGGASIIATKANVINEEDDRYVGEEETMDVVNLPAPSSSFATASRRRHRTPAARAKSVLNEAQRARNTDGSGISVRKERDYDRRFVCEVNDLTKLLQRSVSPYDAKVILNSHVDARRLVVYMLNLANVFGSGILTDGDAVYNLARILISAEVLTPTGEVSHCNVKMLYAPLCCRTVPTQDGWTTTSRHIRVLDDPYDSAESYVVAATSTSSSRTPVTTTTTINTTDTSYDPSSMITDDDRERFGHGDTESDVLLQDLMEHQRTVELIVRDRRDDGDDDAATKSQPSRRRRENFVCSASKLKQRSSHHHRRRGTDIGSLDAMRKFLTSAELEAYANEHGSRVEVLDDLNECQIVVLATLYLFLLTRERVRHSKFAKKCEHADHFDSHYDNNFDDNCNNENCPIMHEERSDGNIFSRLALNFDLCIANLRSIFPEVFVHSYDTNCLADGLVIYVNSKLEPADRAPYELTYSLCVAIVSLFIFSRSDINVLLFFIRYATAIKYPGQFLKSALLLQGTSDSGKSEFVSEVLRQIYSSSLTGTISNATLRNGVRDEVNTDLMSMMNSHVCQCDEPERLNSELFKLLISRTQLKGRLFHEQQPQYLTNLAKIIFTANDHISMRSDAGVVTRLKYCVRMMHRFKALHSPKHDTGLKFDDQACPSVSYQFAQKCFSQGVSFSSLRLGMFLAVEHYGALTREYSDDFFVLVDTIGRRMNEYEMDEDDPREDNRRKYRDLVDYRLALMCGVLQEASERMDNEATASGSNRDDDHDNLITTATISSLFATFASEQLQPPIEIRTLPDEMSKDAKNLHTLIDPYQLFLTTYTIERDVSVTMTDAAIANFIRTFLDESGSNVSRSNLRDTVNKMKERLKMDFPSTFRTTDNTFNLIFKIKSN